MNRKEFLRLSGLGMVGLLAGQNLSAKTSADFKSKGTGQALDLSKGWNGRNETATVHLLSVFTHELAARGLRGEWGRSLAPVDWDYSEVNEPGLSPQQKYARAILSVANNAPLRYIPGELIAGAATLKTSRHANVPCLGKVHGITHTTVGYGDVLQKGYKGVRREILARIEKGGLDKEGTDTLNAMLASLEAARIWNSRYIDLLRETKHSVSKEQAAICDSIIETLSNVPENPPRNYREAVQSLWSMWCFTRIMGNWSGLGRIDEILGPYLKKDLADKTITVEEAREYLAHFWAKGTEWCEANIVKDRNASGDAQHYQNVVIGGIDKYGRAVTNEISYMVLDIVEELHISDFPVAVRLGDKTPDKLLRRAVEVQRCGGGIVAFYSEKTVIDGMLKFGYPLEEAREFTNDGCWETLIPGKTAFNYSPSDMMLVLDRTLHLDDDTTVDYDSFEQLFAAFHKQFQKRVDQLQKYYDGKWNEPERPSSLMAIYVDGCIEKGRDYCRKGPKYNVNAMHMGGIADVANSLYVIKKLVYDEKYIALNDFVNVLRNDWEDNEGLRRTIRNRFEMFGNDNDEADAMAQRVFDEYVATGGALKERNGVIRPVGLSTFGREIEYRSTRHATAHGFKKGDILATNCSPTPGTDKKGPTAAINSFCKLDFTKMYNGATLELKLLPNSVRGENGVNAMMALAKTFRDKGGFYMHVDVVDSTMLIDAQRHPEKYPNLPVRVSGWSARFNTLGKDWQDMIIQRTQQIV